MQTLKGVLFKGRGFQAAQDQPMEREEGFGKCEAQEGSRCDWTRVR